MLHPVVPLNSVNKLDFKTSLQKEIEKSLEEVRFKESVIQNKIGRDLTKHKIALRNHIIGVREAMRNDFDDFFNNMLNCIRTDWNLFEMQEQLSKECRKFSGEILENLTKITSQDEFEQIYYHNDLKKFYENLSEAQNKVQDYKQDWAEFENGVDGLVDSLKSYSEFDIIDGNTLKNYLAENLVMNYSNIEIHKILFQQMMNGNKMLSSNTLSRAEFSRSANNSRGRSIEESKQSSLSKTENQQNISFNRNSQLAMSNNFETTGIRMANKPSTGNQMEVIHTNKIHFFKFD